MSSNDLENKVKVTKFNLPLSMSIIYPRKFGEIPSIDSRDIVHTRNGHADVVKLTVQDLM